MDWLDTKIAEFSKEYKKHGFTAVAFPPCTYNDVGNSHDLSHLIHLRAEKEGQRQLLHIYNLENEVFTDVRQKNFDAAISPRISWSRHNLLAEARDTTHIPSLPDTPNVKDVLSTRNGTKGKGFPKELYEIAQCVVSSKWHEATVYAVERQIHLIEALLPRVLDLDRHDFYLRLAREIPKPPKLTKRAQCEFEDQQALRIQEANPRRYSSVLHIFTYNGFEPMVRNSMANMLQNISFPFKLYWNDKEITLSERKAVIGEKWHLNGVKQ